MLLDVKQISAKYKVSKVSVYKHFNKINANGNFDKYIVKRQNKLYFKQPLINAIINSFDKSHVNHNNSSGKTISAEKYINSLENDKQNLLNENKRLTKLLDHQQQLELSDKKDVDQLKKRIKHLRLVSGDATNQSNNKEHPVKRSFWQRLFGK